MMLISCTSRAENILEIYDLAMRSDARHAAAEAQYRAATQARPQARSALLPQISASVTSERIDDSYEDTSAYFTDDIYNQNTWGVSLTQVLFNRGDSIKVSQADSQIAQAEAKLIAARQDLIVRVAESYFDVLAALDTLEFASAEKEAISRQLEQSRDRFKVGMSAILDVQESQAQYDLVVAQEIDAVNQLDIARENLQLIIGAMPEGIAPFGDQFALKPPEPANIDLWVKVALDNSLTLKAASYSADIARAEISRRRAASYPTVNLTAELGVQDSDGGFYEGTISSNSIGLEFAMPLYTGGLTKSRVAEARSLYQQAQKNLEFQKREATRQTRVAYLNVLAGISRVKALRQALDSTQTAAEAAEAGYEVGTRTAVDVSLALREKYGARRDSARARYDYILSTFRLKQATGILDGGDIRRLNNML